VVAKPAEYSGRGDVVNPPLNGMIGVRGRLCRAPSSNGVWPGKGPVQPAMPWGRGRVARLSYPR